MLTPEQIERAAQQLIQARRTNTPGPALPEDCRPTDGDSAIAIQQRVMEVLGETTGGWKCAVPKPGGLPILSTIPASKINSNVPYVVPGPKGLIEPEVAFVPAHDMPPRATPYTDEEIRREVRNFGVDEDPKTGTLSLEEKGTVYNEMVSSTDQPNRRLFQMANKIGRAHV